MKSKVSVVVDFDLLNPAENKKEAVLLRHAISRDISAFIEREIYRTTVFNNIKINKVGAVPSDSYTIDELDKVDWFKNV